MFWTSFLAAIPEAGYPRELKSAACGLLRLELAYLVAKDHGLEYVPEARLMPGNAIRMRVVHYKPLQEHAGFAVTLHPPARGRVDPARWLADFDTRFLDLSSRWREILERQPEKIVRRMRSCGDHTVTQEDFFSALVLKNLNISVGADADLVFEPAWPFDSRNLCITISHRGKITKASFDG